jgi:hypothetical protein
MAIGSSRGAPSKLLLLVFLVTTNALILANGIRNLTRPNTFQLSDWGISYAGGFVRRGLTGEILHWLHGVTGIGMPSLVTMGFCGLQVLFAVAFFWLARPLAGERRLWPLVYSPVLLVTPAIERAYAGHKEIILFAVFTGALALLRAATAATTRTWIAVGATLLLAPTVLAHEGLFLLAPWFVLLAAAAAPTRWGWALVAVAMVGASSAFLLSLSAPGTAAIRAIVTDRYLADLPATHQASYDPANSAMRYLGMDPTEAARQAKDSNLQAAWMLPFAVLCSAMPLAFAARCIAWTAAARPWLTGSMVAASLAMTAVVMAVAIDWGRFLWMQTVMASAFLLYRASAPPGIGAWPRHGHPFARLVASRAWPWLVAVVACCVTLRKATPQLVELRFYAFLVLGLWAGSAGWEWWRGRRGKQLHR